MLQRRDAIRRMVVSDDAAALVESQQRPFATCGDDQHDAEIQLEQGLQRQQAAERIVEALFLRSEMGRDEQNRDRPGDRLPGPGHEHVQHGPIELETPSQQTETPRIDLFGHQRHIERRRVVGKMHRVDSRPSKPAARGRGRRHASGLERSIFSLSSIPLFLSLPSPALRQLNEHIDRALHLHNTCPFERRVGIVLSAGEIRSRQAHLGES